MEAAWWSLANLKTVRFDDADVAAMEEALRTPGLGDDDRLHLEFAVGKAMHDTGRAAEDHRHPHRGEVLGPAPARDCNPRASRAIRAS